jgi:hypothetical protein
MEGNDLDAVHAAQSGIFEGCRRSIKWQEGCRIATNRTLLAPRGAMGKEKSLMLMSPVMEALEAIESPKRDVVQIPYSDVRNIKLNIMKVWLKRHVEGGETLDVLDNPSFGCFEVSGDPLTVVRAMMMAENVKTKGWP